MNAYGLKPETLAEELEACRFIVLNGNPEEHRLRIAHALERAAGTCASPAREPLSWEEIAGPITDRVVERMGTHPERYSVGLVVAAVLNEPQIRSLFAPEGKP